MRSFNRGLIYSKIVPALAILLGLSYGFTDSAPLQQALTFALAATAALGWLAPASCRSDERAQRHIERHERHDLRRLERDVRRGRGPSTMAGPVSTPVAGGPDERRAGQTPGVVLDGVPQDRLPGEGTAR